MIASEIIKERNVSIKKIKNDVESTFDLLRALKLYEFNEKSKYKWKIVSDGYSSKARIFDSSRKGKFFKKFEIVIDNIESEYSYNKIFDKQDYRIFDALDEANDWISSRLESYQQITHSFKKRWEESNQKVKDNILAYKELNSRR